MSDMTLELRVDANGQTGEPVVTSDGDEMNAFVRWFMVAAIGRLEPGESACLSVTRAFSRKQPQGRPR